jgi:hypothetical protein
MLRPNGKRTPRTANIQSGHAGGRLAVRARTLCHLMTMTTRNGLKLSQTSNQQTKGPTAMLYFIPKARETFPGTYVAMVMQRNARGQMCGSATSGFTFSSPEAALHHATQCARRVSARHPFTAVKA